MARGVGDCSCIFVLGLLWVMDGQGDWRLDLILCMYFGDPRMQVSNGR